MIQELLYTGAGRAVSADELKNLTRLTDPELKEQIERERQAGAAILETLQTPARYYLPERVTDLYRYLWNAQDSGDLLAIERQRRKELADMAKRFLALVHRGKIL